MMCWKLKEFAVIDALVPHRLVRTATFNHGQESLRLLSNSLSTLIRDAPCQWAVTDHRQSLQELTTSDVEHDRIGEWPSGLFMTIEEIFDIVLVYQRPAPLSTESTSQRAFPTASKAFHHNQPHGYAPFSSPFCRIC